MALLLLPERLQFKGPRHLPPSSLTEKKLKMLFSSKNKYQYTYLSTYISLYFRTPKLPENTHTTDGKEFPSPINAHFPVS